MMNYDELTLITNLPISKKTMLGYFSAWAIRLSPDVVPNNFVLALDKFNSLFMDGQPYKLFENIGDLQEELASTFLKIPEFVDWRVNLKDLYISMAMTAWNDAADISKINHEFSQEWKDIHNTNITKTILINPPESLLMSMAMRYDHALAFPGYYDYLGDGEHNKRLEGTIRNMRQLYEEVSGEGFYSKENAATYTELLNSLKK